MEPQTCMYTLEDVLRVARKFPFGAFPGEKNPRVISGKNFGISVCRTQGYFGRKSNIVKVLEIYSKNMADFTDDPLRESIAQEIARERRIRVVDYSGSSVFEDGVEINGKTCISDIDSEIEKSITKVTEAVELVDKIYYREKARLLALIKD